MSESDDQKAQSASGNSIVAAVEGIAESALTGMPAPVRKNMFAALNRLITAAVDIPVARLEGRAAEARAETEARLALIQEVNKKIASGLTVDPHFAAAASVKHAAKITRENFNSAKVAAEAIRTLEATQAASDDEVPDISDDWLNVFEEHAGRMSSENMQRLFGRILAGEIRRPTAYSIKTLNLMAQLDNEAAALFTRFCSLAFAIEIEGAIHDARVLTVTAAASNGLRSFGLSFAHLNVLAEYGLLISEWASVMEYKNFVALKPSKEFRLLRRKKTIVFASLEGRIEVIVRSRPLLTAGWFKA